MFTYLRVTCLGLSSNKKNGHYIQYGNGQQCKFIRQLKLMIHVCRFQKYPVKLTGPLLFNKNLNLPFLIVRRQIFKIYNTL